MLRAWILSIASTLPFMAIHLALCGQSLLCIQRLVTVNMTTYAMELSLVPDVSGSGTGVQDVKIICYGGDN